MGYIVVNVLGALLIVTSLLVLLAKSPRKAAWIYAAQSIVLISIFVALGITTGSTELYEWAGTSFFTKVLFVPAAVLFALKKMEEASGQPVAEVESAIKPQTAVILVVAEVVLCFLAISGISLPTAAEVHPALAISLAHFFVGMTCIVTQRNILKQVFGYCLMENGSHLTLALLAPQAPQLVEVGVATDAIFAVLIMVVVAYRIHRVCGTLDSNELTELKG